MPWRCALIFAAAAACSANDDVPQPAIASVTPPRASAGTSVTVTGTSFCQQPLDESGDVDPLACAHVGTVQVGALPVAPSQYTDTAVAFVVPDLPPGRVRITISVAGRISNGADLTIE